MSCINDGLREFREKIENPRVILKEDLYYTAFSDEEVDLYSDVYTNDTNKRWKNGLVPFEFDSNMTSELKGFVMKAIRRIERVCSVFFKKRTNQANYIRIICGDRFASRVGMIGGKQELYVANEYPNPVGSSLHELMHALGFHHEHCRPDRDEYLEVGNHSINYRKLAESDVCFGPYDPHSIMHYRLNAFMRLRSDVKVDARIGQRIELSEGDINALNKLYPSNSILDEELRREYKRSKRKIEELGEHSRHLRRMMKQHRYSSNSNLRREYKRSKRKIKELRQHRYRPY